jgi:hypothetical protein
MPSFEALLVFACGKLHTVPGIGSHGRQHASTVERRLRKSLVRTGIVTAGMLAGHTAPLRVRLVSTLVQIQF